MNNNLPEILAELRHYFHNLYGERLVQLILYASQARGDAKPDSDIDILVVLDGQVHAGKEIASTSEFIAALCLDRTVVISSAFASSIRFQEEKSPFFLNVRREGVLI
ncbi:MAG: nucleotidyltransferase domain-containing protein [Oscillatoriales cyanobacterium]|uniref:Nucleotidyltransferase domain-containing protein n=1 Tax=Microcoleus anatoxicus PTRS2 TaxID=2705321 RepID=A0ABU8YIU9_9CYAN|nr:MAG: nucleotidyltransferase domain-containing protein [Oscillatoriales cyanobacterium]TAD98821.1 MAG: nucleotidyltransferase domain-containing protein [Oscillatoriales cyanobacterium]TAE06838.1 MAG: nucleotidyltransferase domain-containing protein [Oscillatoriales cyanobacterium]TAF05053.1 MAG: nucleotidyltransferase domain-containing protein [Oscillatoriales cyanobacterium]TAF37128.1 MAG: nucleotidyltransferase domain-containing protein [Oscillatoriales cyanobacterium]